MNTVTSNITEWKAGLEVFKLKTKKSIVALVKKIAFEAYKRTLMKTPVDKGFLRGAWTLALGTPSDANTQKMLGRSKNTGSAGLFGSKSEQMQGQFNEVMAQMSDMKDLQTIWLSNAMPYVETVEFGGYPNPPKKGSYVPYAVGKSGRKRSGTGKWVIKSAGGYSKQAPKGMLSLSIQEVVNWIAAQASKIVEDEAWFDLSKVE